MSLTKAGAETQGVDLSPAPPTDDENERYHNELAQEVCMKKIEALLKLHDPMDAFCCDIAVAAGYKTPMYERIQRAWGHFEAGFDLLRKEGP